MEANGRDEDGRMKGTELELCTLSFVLSASRLPRKNKVRRTKYKAQASFFIPLTPLVWRVSVPAHSVVLFKLCLGAPNNGENREAGETPARSRHCEEVNSEPGDLPRYLQPLNTRAKVFRQPVGSHPQSR